MKYFLILLTMVTVQFSFGQQRSIDSLQIVLQKLESDTAKIQVLNELGMKTNFIDPKASCKYAKQALHLSEINNYFAHIIDTYSILTYSNERMGYYNISLEYMYKKIKIFEKEGDYKQIRKTYYEIANLHFIRGEYDLCLEYLSKIIDHKTEFTDTLLIGRAYSMVGEINIIKEDYEIAEKYWKKAGDIFEKKNDIYGINYVRNGYAKVYERTGQYERALIEYEKALEYCQDNNINDCVCPVLNHIGDVYRKQKMFNKARDYYHQSLRITLQQGMKDSEKESYLLLFKLDSIEGNHESALHNYINYHKILDDLTSQEKENKISELHIKYESMQKTNVIKSMREEEKAKNELIIAISIIVLLLFLTLVFHWRMLRIKNKSNVQLENRNKLINKQKDEISKIANVLSNTNNELKDKNLELTKLLEERKFIQEQLIQSEKMASIGILTAGIAHEINNPVNFIQGGINSLLRDFKDVEKVISEGEKIYSETGDLKEKLLRFKKLRNEYSFKEALESIPEILQDIKLGADRTAQIVKSLSAFARSDDGNYHWLNIHKSIEDSLELLRNKYKENIGIIKQFDGNIPEIRCNPTKINQIFMNLLSNAIDAISGNGKITITTKLLADKISISIKDTGHGISKELQSKIFDPFYTSKPVGKGTGMGLFIVYGLIQENHGSIDLISEPGVGSEFIIKIPIT